MEILGVDPTDADMSGRRFARLDRVLCRRSVLCALRGAGASRLGALDTRHYLVESNWVFELRGVLSKTCTDKAGLAYPRARERRASTFSGGPSANSWAMQLIL